MDKLIRGSQGRSTRTMVYANAVWLFLVKAEWLPIIAFNLFLPQDFFEDADIAGHTCIAISWIMREAQEASRQVARWLGL